MNRPAHSTSEAVPRFAWTALVLAGAVLILIGAEAVFKDAHAEDPAGRRLRVRRDVAEKVRGRAKATAPVAPLEETVEEPAPPAPAPSIPAVTPAPEPVDHASPEDLGLTGIVFDSSDTAATFAVIGGRAYRAGEFCGRWLVRRIERDRVVLEAEDRVELRLE